MRISHVVAAALLSVLPLAADAAQTNVVNPEQLHGIVMSVQGDVLTLRLRNGEYQSVDIAPARAAHHTGVMPVGHAVVVYGSRDASGTFHVVSIGHTSPNQKDWSPDT